jgi:Lar family restriction alleviation protein
MVDEEPIIFHDVKYGTPPITSKLKDCPFCGSDRIFTAHGHSNVRAESFVHCDNCTARVYFNEDETPYEVWNRRPPIKWPTEEMIETELKGYTASWQSGFYRCLEWLKSFVEKGNKE